MYILSSTDRMFRCISTLQCGYTRETLQAGIKMRLNLRQIDNIASGQFPFLVVSKKILVEWLGLWVMKPEARALVFQRRYLF